MCVCIFGVTFTYVIEGIDSKVISVCLINDYSLIADLHIFVYARAECESILLKCTKVKLSILNNFDQTRNFKKININFVKLRRINNDLEKIEIDDIVYLDSDKKYNSKSNNKRIYFRHRKPETLINFSFKGMEEKGFDKKNFMKIHKSYVVNVSFITDLKESKLEVKYSNEGNKNHTKKLPISKDMIKKIKQRLA